VNGTEFIRKVLGAGFKAFRFNFDWPRNHAGADCCLHLMASFDDAEKKMMTKTLTLKGLIA
jgi:hypothetical protein